nr:ATP-binding protein [Prosthecochloris sp. SCSIO W1101]
MLVYADPDALKQVAVNLISNAIKFTSEGGKVSVTLSKNHDTMVLAVDDNGSGIPEKDLERIFEKFYRAR